MSRKLSEFAEKLIEFSAVASEEEVYSTLIKAINNELDKVGTESDKPLDEHHSRDLDTVKEIRKMVETQYKLQKRALITAFLHKDRSLTEPKLVFVMVCLFVFDGNRKKVQNLIGRGLTGQKVYTCHREFKMLSDNIPHEQKIKEIYHLIIKSYE